MEELQLFIGTQLVNAKPMSRLAYNIFRGWVLSNDEDGSDDGYLVEYISEYSPWQPEYAGYISWLPKKQFENTYVPTTGMSFGLAYEAMRKGYQVARAGWNGKGMFIFNVPGSVFKVNRPPLLGIYPEGTEITYHSHVDMKTADDQVVPWLCSQTDMAATDWGIVSEIYTGKLI